ncbi:DNA-binding CsgD family transcriptional regulator [Arthrobacter sp. PL16]|uniref:LuxR C-terminal-related transcriptional regulator n=1 Tax=Arthrobacter sp. PL16 TaxID=3071720 RepID=UPI002DF86F6A|nr:DNA-binding CsgD family transcriptional regulator [Arthrobacter sp. PL16]
MNFLRTDDLLPCRQPVVDALQDVLGLENRHGVLVFGERGMGKSYLLRTLERSAPSGGRRRYVIRATHALRAVPYGALGELLGGVPGPDLLDPIQMLRAVRQRLRSSDGGQAGEVLVDDAQFLDEESAHVLTQLVVTGAIRVVAFADYSLSESSGLYSFANEGYLERLHLEPLPAASMGAVAESALGEAPLGGRAVHHLQQATGGNPMLLNAVLGHTTSGRVRAVDTAGWNPASTKHPVAGPMADLVASILAPMPEPQRKALDLLALGGAVATADVERLTSAGTVRTLVSQRLAVTHPSESRYLTLRHGLYGEVIRATLPLGRQALLRDELGGSSHALPPYGCHRIRHVEWAVDTGLQVEAGTLLDAARVATHTGHLEASERFIRAIPAGHRFEADVERARLLAVRGHVVAAAQLVTGLDAVDDDRARIAVVLQCSAKRLAGEAPSDLLALLDSSIPSLPSAATSTDGDESMVRAQLLRAQLLLDQGNAAAAEVLTDNYKELSPEPRAVALALRGQALGMQGRAVEAEQCTQAALDAATADPYALIHILGDVLAQHILVLAHAGRADQALARLEQAESGTVPFGAADALRGIVLIRQGHFSAGMQSLVPALARLRSTDPQLLLPYALGTASWGAAVLGRTNQAWSLIDEFRKLKPRGSVELGVLGRAFADAAASLSPRPTEPPASLDALMAEVHPAGLRACEKDILVLAVLLGRDEAADLLARLTTDMHGDEALILGSFARAVGAGDGIELGEISDRAAAFGLPLIAVDAAGRARTLQQADSRASSGARSVSRRLGKYSAPFVGTRFEVPGGARSVTDLTRSEAAVARLIATGESNKGIAESLFVSVRTVEGHLHRIYVKLGINGRLELVQELQDQEQALRASGTASR